jgi:hypothetical protein
MVLVSTALAMAACEDEGMQKLPTFGPSVTGWCRPNEPVSIAFPLAEERGEAEVYRLVSVARDHADAVEIVQKLGVTSDPQYDATARVFQAEDEKAEVTVSEHWAFGYTRKAQGGSRPTGEALSEKEAEEVAQGFLRDGDVLPKVDLTMTAKALLQPAGYVEVIFEAANVPWAGLFDWQYISVEVGPDGQVWELNYAWQEPQAIGKYPIISQAEAVERLHACDAYVLNSGHDPDLLEFTEGELAYVGLIQGSESSRYRPPFDLLVPAWVFKGETMEVEGSERPLESAWVPAVADEYLETP